MAINKNIQHGDPNYNAKKFHSKSKISSKQIQMLEQRQKEAIARLAEEKIQENNYIISQPIEVYRRWEKNLKNTLEELQEEGLTKPETTWLTKEKTQLEYKIQLWESKNTPA